MNDVRLEALLFLQKFFETWESFDVSKFDAIFAEDAEFRLNSDKHSGIDNIRVISQAFSTHFIDYETMWHQPSFIDMMLEADELVGEVLAVRIAVPITVTVRFTEDEDLRSEVVYQLENMMLFVRHPLAHPDQGKIESLRLWSDEQNLHVQRQAVGRSMGQARSYEEIMSGRRKSV